jgi:hypothetical protein
LIEASNIEYRNRQLKIDDHGQDRLDVLTTQAWDLSEFDDARIHGCGCRVVVHAETRFSTTDGGVVNEG